MNETQSSSLAADAMLNVSSAGPARVLWVTKGLGLGGAERLLALGLPHIDPDRFEVEVAYVLPWKDALHEEIRSYGITVHCLGAPRPRAAWPARLRRLLRARGYGIVHTHSPVPAVAARFLRPRGTAVVHTEHNEWPRYRRPTRVANTVTYRRNDAVLAVSQGVADSIRSPRWASRLQLPPVEVVHHGIDESRVRRGPKARATARKRLGLEDWHEVVGTVANFTPKKDQRSLLHAVGLLARDQPELRLVMVGSGPLEEALRRQASEGALAGRVLFAGSRDDVQEILPAFDVFALSSLHEGLPIALLEAMAAGLACVATRVGGAPELLEDGRSGLIVSPGEPGELAAAIGRSLEDRRLASGFGEEAARTVGRFSIARAVQRTQAVYEEVLARG